MKKNWNFLNSLTFVADYGTIFFIFLREKFEEKRKPDRIKLWSISEELSSLCNANNVDTVEVTEYQAISHDIMILIL